jgi:hypothetical protein
MAASQSGTLCCNVARGSSHMALRHCTVTAPTESTRWSSLWCLARSHRHSATAIIDSWVCTIASNLALNGPPVAASETARRQRLAESEQRAACVNHPCCCIAQVRYSWFEGTDAMLAMMMLYDCVAHHARQPVERRPALVGRAHFCLSSPRHWGLGACLGVGDTHAGLGLVEWKRKMVARPEGRQTRPSGEAQRNGLRVAVHDARDLPYQPCSSRAHAHQLLVCARECVSHQHYTTFCAAHGPCAGIRAPVRCGSSIPARPSRHCHRHTDLETYSGLPTHSIALLAGYCAVVPVAGRDD